MTGALAALVGIETPVAGSGTPSAIAWANVYGTVVATTSTQTVAGIVGGTTATLSVAITGGATLYVIQNGASTAYAGPFLAADGDTLAFTIVGPSRSGTVTVMSGTFTVGTFNYVCTAPML